MIIHGRGISAAGSAPRWQRGGHGFEPRMLHLESTVFAVLFLCVHKVAAAETGPVIYKIKDAEAAQAASSFFTQKCNKVDTIYVTAAKERQEVTCEKHFLKNIRIPGICPRPFRTRGVTGAGRPGRAEGYRNRKRALTAGLF